MVLSAGARCCWRGVESPSPAARAVVASAAPRSRSRCSLERPPPWRSAGRGLPHPGREIQRHWATKEPTLEQLEVGWRRWPRSSGSSAATTGRVGATAGRAAAGRIDCAPCSEGSTHGRRRRGPRRAIALYEKGFEMELVHRETVESRASRRCWLDVGDGHVELLRPLGPDTAVGKFLAPREKGCTTSPTPSTTSTRRCRSSPPPGSSDRLRAADRHPRQPRRLPPPPLDRRGIDRDRRTRGRA